MESDGVEKKVYFEKVVQENFNVHYLNVKFNKRLKTVICILYK